MDERVKDQSKRLCTWIFFCIWLLCCLFIITEFHLNQGYADSQSAVTGQNGRLFGSFLCCAIFSSMRFFTQPEFFPLRKVWAHLL